MKSAQKKAKAESRNIAEERIDILFSLADRCALSGDMALASNYVAKARSIAMKYNVRLGKRYGCRFCRKCGSYLLPAKTSTVRNKLRKKRIETRCLSCGNKKYQPYISGVREHRRLRHPSQEPKIG